MFIVRYIIKKLIFIFLFLDEKLSLLFDFFAWLFLLKYKSPNISITGSILVRFFTGIIAFGLVGFIFKFLKFFDKNDMNIIYTITSIITSFVLSYIIYIWETYYLYILSGLGSLLVIGEIFYLIKRRKEKIR